jgi:cytochrome P450
MASEVQDLADLDIPVIDFADPAVADDPWLRMREVARKHWIAKTPTSGDSAYALLRFDECRDVYKDSENFRTVPGLGLGSQGITSGVAYDWATKLLLSTDGETHRRLRRLAHSAFTASALEKLRPYARELAGSIAGRVTPDHRADAAKLWSEYGVKVICKLIGWPDTDWQKLHDWSAAALQVTTSAVRDPEQLALMERNIVELHQYAASQLDRLRIDPGDDLVGTLLSAEEAGEALSSEELLMLVQTLLIAGADTIHVSLMFGLYLFAKHPEQWQLLADDASLVPSAVEEVLRFRPAVPALGRIARHESVLAGTRMPEGTFLTLASASANMDPACYDLPETFDIRRFAGGQVTPPQRHLTFGFGPHVCLGAYLARMELQEAFKILPGLWPNLRIDQTDPTPIEWNDPYGVHGATKLALCWDKTG